FLGVFRREWTALGFSVAIFVLYGGAILSLLTYVPGISWGAIFLALYPVFRRLGGRKSKKKDNRQGLQHLIDIFADTR
ncbi:MAG: hypothetical protein KJO34_18520, partial [Deltaproteobacteria bacterium]|nr:hypothetical protein [Deltaproteobacteria bacterium]